MSTAAECNLRQLSLFERPPLSSDGWQVRKVQSGGTCLAYARPEGSSITLKDEAFIRSDEIKFAWENNPEGSGVLRWERHDVSPTEYYLQVYKGIKMDDPFGKGDLAKNYKCWQQESSHRPGQMSWVMEDLSGRKGPVHPYRDVPMRPLINAHEFGSEEEIAILPRADRRDVIQATDAA